VAPAARDTTLVVASQALAVTLAVLALVSACAGQPHRPAATPARRAVPTRSASAPTRPAASAPGWLAGLGTAGRYRVGQRPVTFAEPAHTGPGGQRVGRRPLVTQVLYPLAQPPAGAPAGAGGWPLVLFAPGFMQCGRPYSRLLQAWASAGYVVAVVNFPRTDCYAGAAAYEPDLVNQPADMSYVLSRLLALSAQPGDPFSGLVNRDEIAAAGQSDGGDTVAALAANACCTDHRLAAVAVLSGAEWPPMPGRYFPRGAPPMLFVQGSADTVNPPPASVQLYRADGAAGRYYLDLLGADHMIPYVGTNPVEQLVARVTLAFFDHYLLGQAAAEAAMTRDGNVTGTAALVSGNRLPP
jgi:predicted dienelactone hydrolase